jgi:prevent-host-death family protein
MRKRQVVNVHEAKTHLSRLLARVARGDEVIIAKAGKPIARLIPFVKLGRRPLGQDAGVVDVPEDFNSPLPEQILRDFER